MFGGPETLVDLDRYPIDGRDPDALNRLIAKTSTELEAEGCAVLSGFIREDRRHALADEAERVASFAHRNFNRTNVYFSEDDQSLPPQHPRRRFYDRSNAFVPADNFGPDSPLRRLYQWSPFPAFVQAALGEERFFPYADPLADVIINTAEAGGGFPWHFDTNNFTVTLAIRNSEAGGEFEYAPNMRRPGDENYEGVQRVLDGVSTEVRTLTLSPGDLQIFRGRYALHRVKPLDGPTRRDVAIFSFVEEAGMVGSPERTRQLYGRVLPIHLERAGLRADTLVD